jgi:LPXTG-site transpeptidase (sortase) family protein
MVSKKQFAVLVSLGLLLSLGVFCSSFIFVRKTPQPNVVESIVEIKKFPVRLKIPALNIDAHIESLGQTPEGAMDAPLGPENVSWYNLGPRPGEEGSAVIAGHFGWKDGKAAVFDNLHKLRKGDTLTIENDNGDSVSFVVRETKVYVDTEIIPEVFVSKSGSHLNLITCNGSWNKTQKNYSERLVVFTDRI